MKKIRTYLMVGLIGSVITVAGEMMGGYSVSTNLTSQMTVLFSSFRSLPVWRIGMSSTIGGLGILMQYFGYYAVYLSFRDRKNTSARLFFAANFGFTIVGSLIHVLLCVLIYVYRVNVGAADLQPILIEYFVWFVLPIMGLFMAAYFCFCLLMFAKIALGHSCFPRWCCLMNPMLGKLLIGLVTLFLPPTALVNGISFANMGITSIVICCVLLAALRTRNEETV